MIYFFLCHHPSIHHLLCWSSNGK